MRQVRLLLEELENRTVPSVFTPAQIRHAYGFDQATFTNNGTTVVGDGTQQTIAVVTAFDDPTTFTDLQHFDQTFGIADPPSFQQVDQTGGSSFPAVDSGWAAETALDVEWAHAIAPGANILLVEAKTATFDNLLRAVDYAKVQPGVSVVSMSWGAPEFKGENFLDNTFTSTSGQGGVTFVASSGDNGGSDAPEWPAASPRVVGVGGTSLQVLDAEGTYSTETGWTGSGGGFSFFEPEPAFQESAQTSGVRTVPDVAYNADPGTGVYVYNTDPVTGYAGWNAVGGTSAGAPQWAGLIAIANQGLALAGKGSLDGPSQTLPTIYSSVADFHDITTGNNGYKATTGYDLVTGLGTPVANRVIADLVAAGSSTASGASSGSGGSSSSGSTGSTPAGSTPTGSTPSGSTPTGSTPSGSQPSSGTGSGGPQVNVEPAPGFGPRLMLFLAVPAGQGQPVYLPVSVTIPSSTPLSAPLGAVALAATGNVAAGAPVSRTGDNLPVADDSEAEPDAAMPAPAEQNDDGAAASPTAAFWMDEDLAEAS
jgi:subtilase family serine protease